MNFENEFPFFQLGNSENLRSGNISHEILEIARGKLGIFVFVKQGEPCSAASLEGTLFHCLSGGNLVANENDGRRLGNCIGDSSLDFLVVIAKDGQMLNLTLLLAVLMFGTNR